MRYKESSHEGMKLCNKGDIKICQEFSIAQRGERTEKMGKLCFIKMSPFLEVFPCISFTFTAKSLR